MDIDKQKKKCKLYCKKCQISESHNTEDHKKKYKEKEKNKDTDK